jgi:hypothetical protein
MSHPNYAGNIIVNLASLPDFLRKPILKKRMLEFFTLTESEKIEIINNALEAGPTIPFPNFSKLFKTWLEILVTLDEKERKGLFYNYIKQVCISPQKLISFNLDGIFEIYQSLTSEQKQVLSESIRTIVKELDAENKKRLLVLIPDIAKTSLGI